MFLRGDQYETKIQKNVKTETITDQLKNQNRCAIGFVKPGASVGAKYFSGGRAVYLVHRVMTLERFSQQIFDNYFPHLASLFPPHGHLTAVKSTNVRNQAIIIFQIGQHYTLPFWKLCAFITWRCLCKKRATESTVMWCCECI